MILETFFSGLGTTVLKELIGWAKKRDDARIRAIIRDELAQYPPSTIQVTNIDVLVQQVYLLANVGEWKLSEVAPALLPGGYFNLMQKATGQYLDGNGSTVFPHLANGGVYQDWKAIGVSPNVIKLQHRWSGKLLDAAPDREEAYLLPDNGGLYQQWRVEKVGDQGYFRLRQLATNMLLDAGANGHVYILEDNGGDYQLWKIVNWRIG
jgi:hypothetical protein